MRRGFSTQGMTEDVGIFKRSSAGTQHGLGLVGRDAGLFGRGLATMGIALPLMVITATFRLHLRQYLAAPLDRAQASRQ